MTLSNSIPAARRARFLLVVAVANMLTMHAGHAADDPRITTDGEEVKLADGDYELTLACKAPVADKPTEPSLIIHNRKGTSCGPRPCRALNCQMIPEREFTLAIGKSKPRKFVAEVVCALSWLDNPPQHRSASPERP